MRKLCAKWVPRELTFDQKQRRVDDSEQYLEMIKQRTRAGTHQPVSSSECMPPKTAPNVPAEIRGIDNVAGIVGLAGPPPEER
ncbi:hypothetical protein GWI33_002013 [Rhynchophorus ferrugineus]|uniref:Uncharacterized protein n=1 Tax=Rhynchophorus ferrugineus TaxID=354439 RepID=A0A834HLL9_RHYFE|nr:hypothetical protein GWI33_002013 [Rhynchophorus ferrugineus]